jgi:hypothetical protein
VLALTPDLSMIGYAAGRRVGPASCNVAHTSRPYPDRPVDPYVGQPWQRHGDGGFTIGHGPDRAERNRENVKYSSGFRGHSFAACLATRVDKSP